MDHLAEIHHITTVRLPKALHDWVKEYAAQLRTKPAYIYREAVWQLKEAVQKGTKSSSNN